VNPIFHFYEGRLNMLHKQPYILSAQAFDDVPKLTALQKEALELLEATLEDTDMKIEIALQPGEVVLCSNHCCVHGRTAFEDGEGSGASTRHMLRLWLTLPRGIGRPLPPHYADTREYCDTYMRRCAPTPSSSSLLLLPTLTALAAGLALAQKNGALFGSHSMVVGVERGLWWLLWLPVAYWIQLGAGHFI